MRVADVSAPRVASTSAAILRTPVSAAFGDNSNNEGEHLSSSSTRENNDNFIGENNGGAENSFVAPQPPTRSWSRDDNLFVAPRPPPPPPSRMNTGEDSSFVALQPRPASRSRPENADQAR
jgi:hypothetical protein